MRKGNGVRCGILGLIIAAAMLSPGVALAADLRVTTTQDGDDKECSKSCTLREAVTLAGPDDRVLLPADTYVLTMGELLLAGDEIVGDGARKTLIDAGGNSRVIRVADGTSSVSGVTIARGNGGSEFANGSGGGVFVQTGATLELLDSTVRDNTAERGGGIAAAGPVVLSGSTVSNNKASSRQAIGGGISSTGFLGLVNSTVSGNTAVSPGGGSQGGGVASSGELIVDYSTVAANSAANGGLFVVAPQARARSLIESVLAGVLRLLTPIVGGNTTVAQFSLTNSVLEGGTGGACAGTGLGTLTATGNVVDDGSCQFKDPSSRQDVSTALGPLAANGGPTDTHALLPGSAAINAAGACIEADQRAVARPQTGSTCDAGAFEYRAPTLRVAMAVTNDDGGTRVPGDFSVHVRPSGAADVKGSPQPGEPRGTGYVLDAGRTYEVTAVGPAGYTQTVSGDCTAAGEVALQEGQNRTCTITADDNPQPLRGQDTDQVPPPVGGDDTSQELPPPEPGESVNALPKSGTVRVKLPGAKAYVTLDEGQQLPVGTLVDARKGHVTLIAAADRNGGTATAEFWAGIFRLGQTTGAAPITTLTLVEKLSCPRRGGKASTAAKRKKKRRLWGDGSGRFRTSGEYSSATVRGTKWLVEDRCTSTLTRVVRGRVTVRDFVKKKNVVLRAGKKYVATAGR